MNQKEASMRPSTEALPTLFFMALCLLVTSLPSLAQQPVSFNGYEPGVTRAQAKSKGYEACEDVRPRAPDSAIRCKVPSASMHLAGLPVSSAYLIFKGPKHEKVDLIEVTVAAKPDAIEPALRGQYGPLYTTAKHSYQYIGANDVTVTYYARLQTSPTVLTFKHQPGLYRRQQAAAQARIEREKKLKDF